MAVKYPEIYSDFDVELRRNALTGDVIRKKNLEDIRQSLGLLLRTRYYDKPWKPYIGSYLPTLLFDQDDEYTKQIVKDQITNIVEKYEPRVTLNSIDIDHATVEDEFHGKITIRINYTINVLNVNDTYVYTVNRLR